MCLLTVLTRFEYGNDHLTERDYREKRANGTLPDSIVYGRGYINAMNVSELKNELNKRNLNVKGSKSELLNQLIGLLISKRKVDNDEAEIAPSAKMRKVKSQN